MKQDIALAVQAACADVFGVDDQTVVLTRPDEQFGDYATNVAMRLAGALHKNPREVANALADKLRAVLCDTASEVSVAGPGFLNIRLSDAALARAASEEPAASFAGKTVLVEYSDPNPFKPLHAGHLYTTLVGDMIARLVERAGAKTVRLNYGGDVGLHVGKSMWAIVKHLGGEHPEALTQIAEADRPSWLGARYVEGNNAYEDNESAKQEIIAVNKRVYQLHADNDHTSPFAHIYWTCRQWSYDYFATLYTQLQVTPFDRFIPESDVTLLGVATVREQLAKGVYKKSGDAVVFEGEPFGLHTRVFINSEGLPTYETKDVGLSLTKWKEYPNFDKSIIITANEQAQYMQVVIASIRQFAPEPAEHTVHLTHGVVKLQGGVKMSSRKGNIVSALDILAAARVAGAETGTNPSEETVLAAVKYALAKNRMGGDIVYDPKESIALEGNSGPYLQYAHARARSILAKAEGMDMAITPDQAFQPAERLLLRKVAEFAETVERATEEYMPHYICTYLYELAQVFNHFYEHNRVIGSERQLQRLRLVELYADTLKKGLGLLGITAPDAM
ncbi:MAG TPA: arginine--tRNA ligase [Candidatus Saccharimonadales bacterium]|nr:arginine--tRNA ligase [Candidatus Saccharimonadales bacterium]